jgi:hypothetical protein
MKALFDTSPHPPTSQTRTLLKSDTTRPLMTLMTRGNDICDMCDTHEMCHTESLHIQWTL